MLSNAVNMTLTKIFLYRYVKQCGEHDGKEIFSFEMKNANGMSVTVTNLGGAVMALCVPDKDGAACLYLICPHYLINGINFRKRLLNIKCILIFSKTLSEVFLILRRIRRNVIIKCSCKIPAILKV